MTKPRGDKGRTDKLRRSAEARLAVGSDMPNSGEATKPGAQRLVHELEVHQIELELQNEELSRARTELEQALTRYTDLYELAPVGYLTLARDGTIRQVNLAGSRLLGQERSRLLGRRLQLLVAGQDGPRVDALLAEAFETKTQTSCELALRCGGATEFVELTAAAVEAGGECRVTMSDITVRRRAEAAQRASEQRYRALFERSRDALMTLAPADWSLASGNSAAVTLFGARDEADLISRRLWDYAPELQADGRRSSVWAQEMVDLALREGTQCFDWTQARLSGEEFPASVRLTRVEIEREPLIQATVRDETERMTLLASAAQANRLASMGMLASGVAHEINNPLTYVLYDVETLAEDLPKLAGTVTRCCAALRRSVGDAAFAEIAGEGTELLDAAALENIARSAQEAAIGVQRIRNVSAELGAFSRVERDTPTAVDLNSAIESAIKMAASEIKYRARLVQALGKVPRVHASAGQLAQVFLNLLINAAQAIDEGAVEHNCISVRTWSDRGAVFAEVADTGSGIPAATLPHIFEPFVTTKGGRKGAGIGLAICWKIVAQFGGEIQVESRIGEGARFVVRLPAAGAKCESRPPSSIPASGQIPVIRGRLLLVDDEERLLSTLARLLETAHDVVTAGSGVECQAILEHDTDFDLILCDLMMPEMTGMDLHAWLATRDPRLASRVVFMTGGAFTPRASEYLASVGNLRIDKPFDVGDLMRLVARRVRDARYDLRPRHAQIP